MDTGDGNANDRTKREQKKTGGHNVTKMPFLRRCLTSAAALLLVAGLAGVPAPAGAVTAFKQAVAESAARDDALAAFYRERDFAPLWTGEGAVFLQRRQALLDALGSAHMHGLPEARYDTDALLQTLSSVRHARDMGTVEVALSRLYLQYANDVQSGILTPTRVDSGIKRDAPRRDPKALLAALDAGDPQQVLRSLPPASHEYARLIKEKMRLETRIAQGGWGPTVPSGGLKPGMTGPSVVALRDRLVSMGYLARSVSGSYDVALTAAVRQFQADHGLTEDGIAGAPTLAEINVPASERLKSVIVALERERWLNLPQGRGQRHILVNLTDFVARILDDDKVTFETRAVIGHQDPDRRTPEFSDEMDHMVINPSWYVPRSIIVNEYLPMLRNNPGAVSHIQIVDSRGRTVNRGNGFSQYSARSFPYSMRQPPGPRNALGTVKFMFPNKYNIYLHDTPAKSLFGHEVRTYSHGCVRLNDPHDFAYALLARQESDPVGFFQSILRSGREARVNLEQPVPVHLIYRTAYVPAKGNTQFRRDVYGRDARVWDALSAEGVALVPAGG